MRLRHLSVLVFCCLWTSVHAQDSSTNRPIVRLTLEEAVVRALQNNLQIAIERVRTEGVGYDLKAAYGPYDPVFSLTAGRREDVREGQFQTSAGVPSPGSENITDSASQTIGGVLPYGTEYRVGLTFNHTTGNSGGSALDQYSTDVGAFSLTQPLLRDFWMNSNRRLIRIAKLNRDISDLDFENIVMTVVRDVQKAYYELVAADERIKVRLSAHELATQLARDIRRKVEIGTAAPLEDKEAESKAQTELSAYYSALHDRNTAESRLKGFFTRKYPEAATSKVEPIQKLLPIERRSVDLQESWRNGLAKRPDYRRYFFQAEQQRVNLRFARNQMYPILDLTGGYGRRGLDSISSHPGRPADLGGAFHDIGRNNQPYHSYGVTMSVPFTMQSERANLKRAKVNQEQVLLELEQKEQQVLIEIDDTVSAINSSSMRIKATRLAREFAEEALAAEQKKLDSGVVQPTEVLKRQDALTQARSAENQALLDFNKALTDLDMADGSILDRNSIQLQTLK